MSQFCRQPLLLSAPQKHSTGWRLSESLWESHEHTHSYPAISVCPCLPWFQPECLVFQENCQCWHTKHTSNTWWWVDWGLGPRVMARPRVRKESSSLSLCEVVSAVPPPDQSCDHLITRRDSINLASNILSLGCSVHAVEANWSLKEQIPGKII